MLKLEAEFEFFLAHQDELVAKYQGKYVVIKAAKVLGAYDDQLEALRATEKEHELGTFLIQLCEPGPECYTATYHSRVIYAKS